MRVIPVILVIACAVHHVVLQNHHRPKSPPRGPPIRPPPYPGFVKKWQQLQMANLRGPPLQNNRLRPMPPLPPKMKKPFLPPPPKNLNRLIQTPTSSRPFWKKPPRNPTENSIFHSSTEKYAFVYPKKQQKYKQKEYDFHVQTNQIPPGISSTLNNPIQQVGERGPIHTIPAPNLSPADKPANMQNVQFQFKPETLQHHQYQVTETNDLKYLKNFQKLPENAPVYSQNVMTTSYQAQSVGTSPEIYLGSSNNQQTFQVQEPQVSQQQFSLNFQKHEAPRQQYVQHFQKTKQKRPDSFPNFQNGGQEQTQYVQSFHKQQKTPDTLQNFQDNGQPQQFFQNIQSTAEPEQNSYQQFFHGFQNSEQEQTPQQFTQFQDFQKTDEQIPHQQFLQKLPNFQVLFSDDAPSRTQQPLFVPEPNYAQKQEINSDPEFHSFNYNEQDYQKNSKSSTLADFEPAASEIDSVNSGNADDDAVARSQFVQGFFDSRDENLETNDVENDANGVGTQEEEEETPGFYSSLPNKQVADAFASLQAAGKINNSLMQLSTLEKQRPIKIFVSEDAEKSKNDDEMQDYESLDEEEDGENSEILNTSFGDKIIPKRN